MDERPKDWTTQPEAPDMQRRRFLLRTGLAAGALYVAPTVFRIQDQAEAKGSKRPKGPSKRRAPSRRGFRRPKGSKRRRFF